MIVQRNDLNEIIVIVKKIKKKKNETIQKLNEVKTMIRFLQNDLAKQQNQSSIDQSLRSMKTHSLVITSVFINFDASKAVKSIKLFDEKTLANNNENEFEN